MATGVVNTRKIPELTGLEVGQDAVCFAALTRKDSRTTKYDQPYWSCAFKDKHGAKDFNIWANDIAFPLASQWEVGVVYRLTVRAKSSQRGVDLTIVDGRPVDPNTDAFDGYDPANLFEVSRFDPAESFKAVWDIADKQILDPHLKKLVLKVLSEHEDDLRQMPAAQSMHHAFTGGLIEHIRSMTRVSLWLGKHYECYYKELDPPLNVGLIVAAAILHDIGKIVELRYSPAAATYTTVGQLVGHILLGRDIVRQAAAQIEGFPESTLLELEHAILAHHGRREYGSPVLPQTIEAYIVSIADDLDAKVNQIVKARSAPAQGSDFTESIPIGDGRRSFYRGTPAATSSVTEPDADC